MTPAARTHAPGPTRTRLRGRAAATFLALLALVAAAGCTGTFTPGTPLALLVVQGPEDAPSELLVFAVDPPGPATPRGIRPVGVGTVTPEVDGPVAALDWLDRDETGAVAPAGRRILALLVSERAAAPASRQARVFGYDTSAFAIEAPVPFDPYAPLTVDLVADGVFLPPPAAGVLAPDFGVCLAALSVSRTGRYLALLDDRRACDPAVPASEAVLLVVDLQVPGAPVLVVSTVADPVRGAPPIVDQESDRVEFLAETVSTVVRRVLLADRTSATDSQPLPGAGPLDPALAFARHGAGRLAIVGQALHHVDAAGAVVSTVTTAPNAIGIVETAPALPVVVHTTTGIAVHRTPSDDDERFLSGAYAGGTTDLPDVMAYLVRPGAIDTLDLLLYDPTLVNPIAAARTTYGAPSIVAPRAITYFRPIPALP